MYTSANIIIIKVNFNYISRFLMHNNDGRFLNSVDTF